MTRLLDPDSADLTLLQDRQVAVLGFDDLAAAHALNLRDSGVDVWVGAAPDSRSAARAEMEGLEVRPPEEAVARCDIVLVPTGAGIREGGGSARQDGSASRRQDADASAPLEESGSVRPGSARQDLTVQRLVDEHTEPGDLVVVTSGRAVRDGGLRVPDGVDLAMLRAVGDADRVRAEYLDGRGCPALVAVDRDGSGAAWATLTAYAAAMGALRSGAIVTTLEHEAEAMAYAETNVFLPLQRSVEAAFDELVARGVEEEVAYLAVVHGLKARVDQIHAGGLAAQCGSVRQPGSGPVDGGTSGQGRTTHPLDRVGRRVRSMMSWIR